MIVENKEYIVTKANDIASLLLVHLAEEAKTLAIPDEPAENVYLYLYIISFIVVKTTLLLEEFCKTFDIKGMTQEKIIQFINEITKEIIETND